MINKNSSPLNLLEATRNVFTFNAILQLDQYLSPEVKPPWM